MTNIGDQTFEHYTIDLFRKWGIGSKDKNNGVMIFDLEGRRSRIEVGYGLEGALSDGKQAEFKMTIWSRILKKMILTRVSDRDSMRCW